MKIDIGDVRARPTSAQGFVLEELRRWLISGRLRPGDQVHQEAVASELRTSVVPVREALKTLETVGQIEHLPRRGFFVANLSRDELIELCDIRSALETIAVDRALESVGDTEVHRMRELMESMAVAEEREDVVELVRLDREFHFVVFGAAGVSQLTRLITTLWDQSDLYRAAFFRTAHHRELNRGEHEQIVDAIARRDRDGLVRLLDQHRLSPLADVVGTASAWMAE